MNPIVLNLLRGLAAGLTAGTTVVTVNPGQPDWISASVALVLTAAGTFANGLDQRHAPIPEK